MYMYDLYINNLNFLCDEVHLRMWIYALHISPVAT